MNTKQIVRLSAVAALYVALTLLFSSVAYREIQFRVSEVLVLLCFFRKDYKYAIILGCLISNFFSPMMFYDIVFGTFQTIVAVELISRSKNLFLSSLYPVLTMPIIALELYLALNLPFLFTSATVMLGEFVVVVLVGYPLFLILRSNHGFLELIEANQNVEDYNEI